MELSPQSVATTSFKTVKKGYDPVEVRSYLESLSKAVEGLQSQATAMEARARAAVARLQELNAQQPGERPADSTPAKGAPVADVAEAETISRTLLLAQRTADTTVAEAQAEAKRVAETAAGDARTVVAGAHDQAARLIEEAKVEARRAGEGQRVEIESEVQALLARREFLISDVDHLELHIITQRDRLREVATSLNEMVERVPGGLADIRRPLVSAVEPATGSGDGGAEGESDPVLEAIASSSAVTALDHGADAAAPAWSDHQEPADGGDTGQRLPFDDVTAEVPRMPDGITIRGDDLT